MNVRKTRELLEAESLKLSVGICYVEFHGDKHAVRALTIDGAIRLAVDLMSTLGLTARQFGSLGGCHNGTESEALSWYKLNKAAED